MKNSNLLMCVFVLFGGCIAIIGGIIALFGQAEFLWHTRKNIYNFLMQLFGWGLLILGMWVSTLGI
jgi:hypothetical protein